MGYMLRTPPCQRREDEEEGAVFFYERHVRHREYQCYVLLLLL
jgi:hypothetical protein